MNQRLTSQNQPQFQSGHTFSAKEKDDETGYSYFGARYYDSDLSVWLSVDPMSDAFPSISSYAYCYNNPINYTDAWGLYGDEASAQNAQQKATAKYGEARVGDVYYNSKKNEYAFQIYGKGKDKYNHTNSKGVNFAWRPDASVYNDKQYNNYANPSTNSKSDYPNGNYLSHSLVNITFSSTANHKVNPNLQAYINQVLNKAYTSGINTINISCTTEHSSNASRSAHTVINGARGLDINTINGQHVGPNSPLSLKMQYIIKSTPGYLENYGPQIINKISNGKPIDAPWARTCCPDGHYSHIHLSIPR